MGSAAAAAEATGRRCCLTGRIAQGGREVEVKGWEPRHDLWPTACMVLVPFCLGCELGVWVARLRDGQAQLKPHQFPASIMKACTRAPCTCVLQPEQHVRAQARRPRCQALSKALGVALPKTALQFPGWFLPLLSKLGSPTHPRSLIRHALPPCRPWAPAWPLWCWQRPCCPPHHSRASA